MPYAELIARSCFSLLEGASQPHELIDAAREAGAAHLGLVDRDCVYGLVQAHKAASDSGVHLLCGATVTVASRPPVVLLAQNRCGWSHLTRVLTSGRADVPKGTSRVELSTLLQHAEGLFCLLGYGWSSRWASPLREAFGDRLAVALHRNRSPADRQRTAWAVGLSQALDAPLVASNDVIVHEAERRPLADVLTAIRRRTTLEAAGRALHVNNERYLLKEKEFRDRFHDLPRAVDHASRIAEACTFSLSELKYTYPREVVPEGRSPMSWLVELTERGLVERYPTGVPESVRASVRHELGVIEDLDFPSYFLTVYDIVRFARDRGILCQGRGSAANSAVCYALGVTSVDPARSTLLFERFISKERGEPPDIDVDFEHERREEVIQYIYNRYGRHRAALVNEFITYRGRSAIRDVGKVFGLSLDQVDRLARGTDRWSAGEGAALDDLVREAGLDPCAPAVAATLSHAAQLRSMPRHLSIHVGGFVIAADELIDLVPVEPATMKDRTVIQWDKYDVDALNFVKVDVLGLGMLTAIRKAFGLIEGFCGRALTLASVPAEDQAVYDMFCRADTVGVFQIESRAQMSMLPRLKPRCFYDLVIEVAIVRPGPIQGGMVHPYLRRRTGEEEVTYAHPALEPILERTLGVPLFQEQVMAMAVAVGGFTPGKADRLRRAMGAWRKRGNLREMGASLVEGMVDRGIPRSYAEAIFSQILGFGEYGFPESHAASFALLVYVSGWLKCHYPAAFASALINSQPMGFYSPRALLADAQRHGVVVRPVSATTSTWNCTLERGEDGEPQVRAGLRLVRGLGEEDALRIAEAREERPFLDLPDFAVRTRLDKGALAKLAEADAFADLDVDRRRAAWILQGLWTDLPLFAPLVRAEPAPPLPPQTPLAALQADYRTVGFSVDQHPVGLIRSALKRRGTITLDRLPKTDPGTKVRIAGLVSSRQRPGTASGVVFLSLEDETAIANLVVWPRTWAKYRRLARSASLLGADGILQRQGDAVSVLVDHFWEVPAPAHAEADEDLGALPVRARNFH
jgi:error-prone DNA polymerase